MKYFILLLIIIILLSSLVSADSTFFDNPNDAFIMGGSTTSGVIEGTTEATTSGEGCLTNWTCSNWSSCNNRVKIRNCTKTKTYCYADLKKKPIESQNCSIDKSDKSEEGITISPNEKDSNTNNVSLFSIKIIILVVLTVIAIGFIIFYKRHKKRRHFRYGY
ncbi:MAG: hypothetical protein AABX29_05415 [Nanoarchaeota archaeon]